MTAPAGGVDLAAIEHALGAAWLHSAISSTAGFVAVHDVDGTLRYVSPSVRAVLGHDPEAFAGELPIEVVHPEDRKRTLEMAASVLTEPRRVVTLNLRARHRDGTWRWLESQMVNVIDHPMVQGVVTSSRDVTDRREEREHAEAARRAGEARFRALVERSSDFLAIHSADGTLKYMSPSAERFLGVTLEDVVGHHSLYSFVHPEDRDVNDLDSLRQLTGAAPPRLLRVRNHRGEWRWLELITTNLLDDKNVQGFVTNGRDVTERVETTRVLLDAEDAVRHSEERFRALAQHASDMVSVLDGDGNVLYSSPAASRIMGYPVEDWRHRGAFDLVHPDDLDEVTRIFARTLEEHGPTKPTWVRVKHADGSWRWLEALGNNLIDDPAVGGIVIHARDVTDQRVAEEAARRSQALVSDQARVLEAIATGEALGEILDEVCRVVERHFPGTHCSIQLVDDDGSSVHHGSVAGPPERSWATPILSSVDQRKFGTFSVSYEEPREPDVEHKAVVELLEHLAAIAIQRNKNEAKLAHQAHHDPLTGLPNRMLFLEFLQLAIARARRYDSMVAVLFLDLDRFKLVNDSLGHDAGDELLVALGQRLRGVVRPGDTVARFGGDEFTVLCEDLPAAGARSHATDVAQRLLHVIEQPFLLEGEEQYLSASIGISLAGPGTERPEGLLRDADAAMYRAKERGKGRWELFDEVMRATALERLETENALHRALDRGELRVHYQPVISLRERRCIGAEALVRWAHPERGLLTPKQFIDLAEESGLVVPVGQWVIEEACRRSRQWRAEHGPSFVVSVNLSGRQLSNPELAENVTASLGRTGADPAGLCFEITESVLMDDVDTTIGAISALKGLGVTLSIDDFGTGYSSLGYLKRFPVDAVKVDRSFIDGLGADPEDSAIVAAVVSLGHALGLTVIAEGVETDRQLAELCTLGCDAAQGYLFARPGPGDDLTALVDRVRLATCTSLID